MKFGKFKVNKKKTGGRTKFIYPLGYFARCVGSIVWCCSDNVEGDNLKEFVATVADDYFFGVNMVEIDRAEYDSFIDTAGGRQKDSPSFVGVEAKTAAENKTKFIKNHKAIADDHEAIVIDRVGMKARHAHYWSEGKEANTMDVTTLE